MRAFILLALAVSLVACPTSNLGSCSKDSDCTNGSCDVTQHVCVLGPSISSITFTPPGVTDAAGNRLIGPGSGPISVRATIAGPSGVAPSSVCLRLAGETGACAHPGTAAATDTYTFSLPRPAPPQDGSAPLNFTLEAEDNEQHRTHVAQSIFFDYQGPSISVAADSTPYARTAVPIPVTALIADPAGVPDGGVFLNGTIAPVSRDGGLFTFNLDPRGASAGVEGPYAFQVSAVDSLANASDAGASRIVDDAPPAASVSVFKGTDPGTTGVTYPAAVPNTGWTGDSFIYTDTVHVKGTLNDVSGIGAATVEVDGTDINGAAVAGPTTSLGCGAGTSCSFDVSVPLSQQTEFHTGTGDAGFSGALIPSGFLQVTINARDNAASADRTAATHAGTTPTPARVTRFLWQQAVAAGNVTGMAVHPDGDLIVATDSATGDTLYDFAPDQPQIRWHTGSALSQPIGAVADLPAIGAGDATSANVYLASTIGNLYAFAPDGGNVWQAITASGSFAVSPLVDSAAWTDGGTIEQLIEPSNDGAQVKVFAASTSTASATGVNTSAVDGSSSPMMFGNAVWLGTGVAANSGHVTRHLVSSAGAIGAASNVPNANGIAIQPRPYYGLVTDGTLIFAATVRPGSTTRLDMYGIDPAAFVPTWDTSTAHLSAEPTLGIDGKLYASDFNDNVSTVTPATGAFTTLLSLGSANGLVPMHGSDGHFYLPTSANVLLAQEGSKLSWMFMSAGSMLGSTAMDCSGRLFVAGGGTVYAFVSDDRGLADTAWPSLRRDARNTGNANAPRYGSRTVSGCTQ